MPVIKSALTRYYIINECLTHPRKKYWTMEELMRKCENKDIVVSKRTLELDLHAMRYDERLNYQAPIAYDKKNKGFHYTDPSYSLEKLPVNENDIEMFEVLLESFQRIKGSPGLNQVGGMFEKLGKVVSQLREKKSKSQLSYPVVAFEKIPYYKGIEYFDPLYKAIMKQHPVQIAYKRFDRERAVVHVVHPYLLKEYKFRWYLLGYSEKRRGKLIFALDRIENLAVNKTTAFKPYKGIDIQKYFNHTIGVTINSSGVKEVKLWFSPSQGNYIKTQHLHETQEIIIDDQYGLVVTLNLVPNYELMQMLLGFGPEVKVLEPVTLHEEMKELLRRSLALY
jgi:predicted DNA-binding transcriptional regulator YafY